MQAIALLHCLLTHPALVKLVSKSENETALESKRLVSRVLIVVPVSVLVHWRNEFAKWLENFSLPKIRTFVLNEMTGKDRDFEIKEKWGTNGGILFASPQTLLKFLKPSIDKKDEFADRHFAFFSPGPDGEADNHIRSTKSSTFLTPNVVVVVVDEAHLFLKNDRTGLSKLLSLMDTRRRISLTGTPLQNNLMEYYHMANWVRPNYLGPPNDFECDYVRPIMESLNVSCYFYFKTICYRH